MGSLARYINHCDKQNSQFTKKNVEGSERCGVYAIWDIPRGTEITCHYI